MEINQDRYDKMIYKRVGKSGLKLPLISLGLWYNFGEFDDYEVAKEIVYTAFNNGITHFDLANNYGPPVGEAERTFGKILKDGLMQYRDELVISTKAGFDMWPGPYGNWGSRKYLIASLDQSLERLGLDYVDIFYHHRPDPETDINETMLALRDIVLSGKALYIGLSRYTPSDLDKALPILKELKVPFIINQPRYSMMKRLTEKEGLYDYQLEHGLGSICFSVLQQGLLTNKYVDGIPSDSRAAKSYITKLESGDITPEYQENIKKLKVIADQRGQTIAQLSIAWALRHESMSSVLIGASRPSQVIENIGALNNLQFTDEELNIIDELFPL
jgi:L-glyceraldehyde 3-phosphate reductase